MVISDGIATPVMIFDPLLSSDKLYNLPNRSLNWQGKLYTASDTRYILYIQGDYVPNDAPVPSVLTSTLAEQVIAGILSSFGIMSTIFFFSFNLYYSKHW